MSDETRRLTARITGMVQGVGFRYWTARKADELALKGTVRNEHDGSVMLVAEGADPDLAHLVAWLQSKGAPGRVDDVDINLGDATGEFTDFRISG